MKIIPVAIVNFPPFEFEKDGKITGIDTEIITRVLNRMGYSPDIHVLPWTRAQKYVATGKFAAIYSLTKTSKREKFYYFSIPINAVKDVFFKLKKKSISWKKLDDIKDYNIGVSLGYSYDPVFMKFIEDKKFRNIYKIAGKSLELRQLRMIKAGRIDVGICEISVCRHLIKKHSPEFDMVDYINRPVGKIRPYYIAFSKKWPGSREIVQRFNSELARFIREGKRDALFRKYGLVNPFSKQNLR